LIADFEWNRKRYNGIKDKQRGTYFNIQTKILNSVFEKTAEDITKLKVYTPSFDVLNAKVALQKKKIFEEDIPNLDVLPDSVRYMFFFKADEYEKTILDYERSLESIKPYVVNVSVVPIDDGREFVFPVKTIIDCEVQQYFIQVFKTLERDLDKGDSYLDLNDEYISFKLSTKDDDKKFYQSLNTISKYTGLVFRKVCVDENI
jgi:hypothetical protein